MHTDLNDGYLDPDRQLPWQECRSTEAVIDRARDLDSEPVGLSAYAATAFRFGTRVVSRETRVLLEIGQRVY